MKTTLLLTAAVIAIAAAAPVRGAEETLEGTWEGFLRPSPIIELRIVLKVDPPEEEGGPPRAAFFSPDQGTGKVSFPADPIALDGKAVTFTVQRNGGSFSGTIERGRRRDRGGLEAGAGQLAADPQAGRRGPRLPRDLGGDAQGRPRGAAPGLPRHPAQGGRPPGDVRQPRPGGRQPEGRRGQAGQGHAQPSRSNRSGPPTTAS